MGLVMQMMMATGRCRGSLQLDLQYREIWNQDGWTCRRYKYRNNATVHHNVLWDIKTGIMVKGNYHHAHNNAVFGNDSGLTKNQIIVLFENGAGMKIQRRKITLRIQ